MNEPLWRQTLENLANRIDAQQYNKWLANLTLVKSDEEQIELVAPNNFVRDWVYENYLPLIQEEVKHLSKQKLAIKISAPEESLQAKNPIKTQVHSSQKAAHHTNGSHAHSNASRLRKNYTFKEFVVGASNQFAHAASIAVSEQPGGKYNPLFIFGGVGLGKTHLLHAVGHQILENFPNYRIIYLSTEAFVNELINAIRFEKMHEFREKYRTSCDVLLIDDIQFLSGKERTQEEFFHTFNTLYEAGKQIILSSDTFPKDLNRLEERLRSRFEWGLIADIQAPEMETRVAIVRQKAEANDIFIPDEVAHFLATLMKSNVRELEGSLIRLGAYASLTNQEITLELAKEVLKDFQGEKDRFLSIAQVQEVVGRHFRVNQTDLKSSKKSKNLTYPRQIAMYLCRKELGSSFPDIGSKFGGKDHSTVIHAVKKIENLLKTDDQLRADIHHLQKALNG